MQDPIAQLAKDLDTTPQQAAALAADNGLPTPIPADIADKVASIRWDTIREAAGLVC